MTVDSTASRFLRPPDVARLRRNQRQIQVQRLLVLLRSVVVVACIAGAALWTYRQTQSDARFAVRAVEVTGVIHTPAGEIESITSRYVGLNLFRIDLARVQEDLRDIAWIREIGIEKTLPDLLRIKITERSPVALLRSGERLLYVDAEGVGFAELSPAVGNDDLPVISEAEGAELLRTVALLRHLRSSEPAIYSRISEIWPVAPRGFAFYDRGLGATVYVNADDLSSKFRSLLAILRAENNPGIEYADLRFASRVVVKPTTKLQSLVAAVPRARNDLPPATSEPIDSGGGEYVQD